MPITTRNSGVRERSVVLGVGGLVGFLRLRVLELRVVAGDARHHVGRAPHDEDRLLRHTGDGHLAGLELGQVELDRGALARARARRGSRTR